MDTRSQAYHYGWSDPSMGYRPPYISAPYHPYSYPPAFYPRTPAVSTSFMHPSSGYYPPPPGLRVPFPGPGPGYLQRCDTDYGGGPAMVEGQGVPYASQHHFTGYSEASFVPANNQTCYCKSCAAYPARISCTSDAATFTTTDDHKGAAASPAVDATAAAAVAADTAAAVADDTAADAAADHVSNANTITSVATAKNATNVITSKLVPSDSVPTSTDNMTASSNALNEVKLSTAASGTSVVATSSETNASAVTNALQLENTATAPSSMACRPSSAPYNAITLAKQNYCKSSNLIASDNNCNIEKSDFSGSFIESGDQSSYINTCEHAGTNAQTQECARLAGSLNTYPITDDRPWGYMEHVRYLPQALFHPIPFRYRQHSRDRNYSPHSSFDQPDSINTETKLELQRNSSAICNADRIDYERYYHGEVPLDCSCCYKSSVSYPDELSHLSAVKTSSVTTENGYQCPKYEQPVCDLKFNSDLCENISADDIDEGGKELNSARNVTFDSHQSQQADKTITNPVCSQDEITNANGTGKISDTSCGKFGNPIHCTSEAEKAVNRSSPDSASSSRRRCSQTISGKATVTPLYGLPAWWGDSPEPVSAASACPTAIGAADSGIRISTNGGASSRDDLTNYSAVNFPSPTKHITGTDKWNLLQRNSPPEKDNSSKYFATSNKTKSHPSPKAHPDPEVADSSTRVGEVKVTPRPTAFVVSLNDIDADSRKCKGMDTRLSNFLPERRQLNMQLRRYLIRQKSTSRSRDSFSYDSMNEELNQLLKHTKSSSVDGKPTVNPVNKRNKTNTTVKHSASFDDNVSEAGTYLIENDVKDLDITSDDENAVTENFDSEQQEVKGLNKNMKVFQNVNVKINCELSLGNATEAKFGVEGRRATADKVKSTKDDLIVYQSVLERRNDTAVCEAAANKYNIANSANKIDSNASCDLSVCEIDFNTRDNLPEGSNILRNCEYENSKSNGGCDLEEITKSIEIKTKIANTNDSKNNCDTCSRKTIIHSEKFIPDEANDMNVAERPDIIKHNFKKVKSDNFDSRLRRAAPTHKSPSTRLERDLHSASNLRAENALAKREYQQNKPSGEILRESAKTCHFVDTFQLELPSEIIPEITESATSGELNKVPSDLVSGENKRNIALADLSSIDKHNSTANIEASLPVEDRKASTRMSYRVHQYERRQDFNDQLQDTSRTNGSLNTHVLLKGYVTQRQPNEISDSDDVNSARTNMSLDTNVLLRDTDEILPRKSYTSSRDDFERESPTYSLTRENLDKLNKSQHSKTELVGSGRIAEENQGHNAKHADSSRSSEDQLSSGQRRSNTSFASLYHSLLNGIPIQENEERNGVAYPISAQNDRRESDERWAERVEPHTSNGRQHNNAGNENLESVRSYASLDTKVLLQDTSTVAKYLQKRQTRKSGVESNSKNSDSERKGSSTDSNSTASTEKTMTDFVAPRKQNDDIRTSARQAIQTSSSMRGDGSLPIFSSDTEMMYRNEGSSKFSNSRKQREKSSTLKSSWPHRKDQSSSSNIEPRHMSDQREVDELEEEQNNNAYYTEQYGCYSDEPTDELLDSVRSLDTAVSLGAKIVTKSRAGDSKKASTSLKPRQRQIPSISKPYKASNVPQHKPANASKVTKVEPKQVNNRARSNLSKKGEVIYNNDEFTIHGSPVRPSTASGYPSESAARQSGKQVRLSTGTANPLRTKSQIDYELKKNSCQYTGLDDRDYDEYISESSLCESDLVSSIHKISDKVKLQTDQLVALIFRQNRADSRHPLGLQRSTSLSETLDCDPQLQAILHNLEIIDSQLSVVHSALSDNNTARSDDTTY